MKTVVNTRGQVIQQGDGEGLIVANEDRFLILEISEVSDDQTINLFGNVLCGNLVTKNDADSTMTADFEILADMPPTANKATSMAYNAKQCEDEDDAARMSEVILRSLGYVNVQRGTNTMDVNLALGADALRTIAQNAERIGRWSRAELKKKGQSK